MHVPVRPEWQLLFFSQRVLLSDLAGDVIGQPRGDGREDSGDAEGKRRVEELLVLVTLGEPGRLGLEPLRKPRRKDAARYSVAARTIVSHGRDVDEGEHAPDVDNGESEEFGRESVGVAVRLHAAEEQPHGCDGGGDVGAEADLGFVTL